jgi:hypothetical protein
MLNNNSWSKFVSSANFWKAAVSGSLSSLQYVFEQFCLGPNFNVEQLLNLMGRHFVHLIACISL